MDVVGGFVLVAVLVAVLWLAAVGAGWLRSWVLERRGRAWRRVQVRKADRWRFDLEEREALVAMRRVADDVDQGVKLCACDARVECAAHGAKRILDARAAGDREAQP